MPPEEPLVSVVVPAWNAGSTLGETLKSAAAQTYRKLEIVVVDDGSTDNTAALVENFCRTDSRARLIKRANGGPAAARNSGIGEARGDWIALLDADDLWHPTKIEKQVAAALAAPEAPGFVYCWYRNIDERGFVTGSGPRWAADGAAFRQLAYRHFIRGGSALLLSRSAYEKVGGFDESFVDGCEDMLLEMEIARIYPIVAVPEYLFGYRSWQGNFTKDFSRITAGWRRAYAVLQERGNDIPPRVARWARAHCSFDVADERALSGKAVEALPPLMRALALDPVRSGLRATARLTSLARRPIRRTPALPSRHFYDVSTTEPIEAPRSELRVIADLMHSLDVRRMRRL